jgi:hypothetical protein
MCDASGAVELSSSLFVAVSDEDNVLRLYDADRPGRPLREIDLSSELNLLDASREPARAEEGDIEAATRIGDLAFFLTSHGRNKSGKLKPARFRFFATTAPADGSLALVGTPYERLLEDLLAEPSLAAFDLESAAELPPKAPNGLNLEGMTERHEGGVWLGFRNPVPKQRALLIPLENPEQVIRGQRARFGAPITLNLGGLGVRGLSWFKNSYLVAAGAFDDGAPSRLFAWDGRSSVRELALDLRDFNPEGFFTPDERDRFLLLSDDGSRKVQGKACKRLRDARLRSFRAMWIKLP